MLEAIREHGPKFLFCTAMAVVFSVARTWGRIDLAIEHARAR